MSEKSNPCQSCGACCANFRVSFYWAEADDGGGAIPSQFTEKVNDWTRCMRGTWSNSPRCVALQGEVGPGRDRRDPHRHPDPRHARRRHEGPRHGDDVHRHRHGRRRHHRSAVSQPAAI
ncbi:YkgJ family cysteine cluster protein [Chromobacterium amazonense]|uniref:YkgJ family cysteine cluster protein n=1 Tax=Chromobacterium amazonense TaxID=1382803 RepID=UPI003B969341